ncbi:Alkbh3 [Symbiodinium microadriaticum]|nr:Alkbh3 [Symbiodinium microadriaticum]
MPSSIGLSLERLLSGEDQMQLMEELYQAHRTVAADNVGATRLWQESRVLAGPALGRCQGCLQPGARKDTHNGMRVAAVKEKFSVHAQSQELAMKALKMDSFAQLHQATLLTSISSFAELSSVAVPEGSEEEAERRVQRLIESILGAESHERKHGAQKAAAIEPQPPMTGLHSFSAIDAGKVTEVRQKNQQLRVNLKTLPWPELRRFQAHGHVYDLPLQVSSERSAAPIVATESRLRFLAGFFDGDGSVGSASDLSGCYLHVSQSFDKAVILMLLRDTFGGSIRLSKQGAGLRKPVLTWRVCGQSARRAASLLAPRSITKQKQLLLAAHWPGSTSKREDSKAELRDLKSYDSAVVVPCSWEYCAGFFDAEGCIRQTGAGASLTLQIDQKHPQVLVCLRDFFVEAAGVHATIRTSEAAHRLCIHGLPRCKAVLQQMLDVGLLCKAKQAKLALSLTAENAAQVSTELVHLTGNQAFGKSLDLAGQGRATRIRSLTQQIRNRMKRDRPQEAEVMLRNLEALKLDHDLLNARHENEELLRYESYIRHLHNTCWKGP